MAVTAQRPLRFLPQALDVVERALRDARTGELREPPTYDTLSRPHLDSPFLTLAEYTGQGLPASVVKLLMVPRDGDDAGYVQWSRVLQGEASRLAAAMAPQTRPTRELQVLALPVTRDLSKSMEMRTLSGIRWGDVLHAAPGTPPSAAFSYFVRPYIPWPTLREAGISEEERAAWWRKFGRKAKLPGAIRKHPSSLDHFSDETLLGRDRTLFVVSGWRWRPKFG